LSSDDTLQGIAPQKRVNKVGVTHAWVFKFSLHPTDGLDLSVGAAVEPDALGGPPSGTDDGIDPFVISSQHIEGARSRTERWSAKRYRGNARAGLQIRAGWCPGKRGGQEIGTTLRHYAKVGPLTGYDK
jgi:hypothetical protein